MLSPLYQELLCPFCYGTAQQLSSRAGVDQDPPDSKAVLVTALLYFGSTLEVVGKDGEDTNVIFPAWVIRAAHYYWKGYKLRL